MDPVTVVIDAAALESMRIDGRSLVVKGRGRSAQRIPLHKVLRIDITGCPTHAFDCLVELASKSIPITVFATNGRLRAQMFNPLPSPKPLAHWIGDMVGNGQEARSYRAWREHHLRRLLRASGLHGGRLSTQCHEHDRLLDIMVEKSGLRSAYVAYVQDQEPMLLARIGEHLLRCGLTPGGPAYQQLATDLELLSQRWLCTKAIDWLGRLGNAKQVQLFERFLRAIGSNGLDDWLGLMLERLNEAAVACALHRDGVD
ncbi:MAG: CRISPR-associated endonuclease Cas1 [Pseudomonadales bacterium]|jgi:hypothetical protein|nr:CRISPR-associated endonuclease Cas1 [Pseudomonadales bacterium]MCP5338385.1 CRISPR-associated endonuclease Cas1 [Pseudomonadales bacterium]